MQAFADVVRQGKVLYVGVSEWTAEQLRAGAALAKELGFQLISNQPQYSALWRVIEGEVVPTSEELGISQIVWSPIAQGVLTGKYQPGQPLPEGSRATDDKGGAKMIERFMNDEVLTPCRNSPVADELSLSMASSRSRGCCRTRTWRRRSSVPRVRSRCTTTPALPGADPRGADVPHRRRPRVGRRA